jgi:hypothetical protein
MTVHEIGLKTLAEALSGLGFKETDEFGLFVTFQRENDPLKLHVGPDGSFAAFDGDDEVVAEGKGAQDLYALLVAKTGFANRSNAPARGTAALRRR